MTTWFSRILLTCFLTYSAAEYSISEQRLKEHVEFFTADVLEGRLTGSPGEQLATQYIAQTFRDIGLVPAGDNGSFFQEFTLPGHPEQKGRNVLALLKRSTKNNQMTIIGAHADHLGHGELGGSRAGQNQGAIHPGADDNASGVAVVLEAAAQLSALDKRGLLPGTDNILFAAWSGEEYGVLGSTHFMTHYTDSITSKTTHSKINTVINLDMVGHLDKNLIIQGVGSSTNWAPLINSAKLQTNLKVSLQNDPYLPTDSTSFYIKGIPGINLFTGAHDDYHTPNDRATTLNYKGIKKVTEFVITLCTRIMAASKPIAYHECAKPKNHNQDRLNIYLGTIPDYAHSNHTGVTLSGVAHRSPAEQGGLKQGDVIVTLARSNIHDIYDYSKALNALTVDKPVTLAVIRNGKKIQLTVTPRYR